MNDKMNDGKGGKRRLSVIKGFFFGHTSQAIVNDLVLMVPW